MSEIIFTQVMQQKGESFPGPVVVGPAEIKRTSRLPSLVSGVRSSLVNRGRQRRLEPAGRREPLHIVIASDEFGVDEDLRHGCSPGRLLEELLDGAITRLANHVELGDVHAQTIDLTKHPQRVLGIGSVALREDDGRVAERELRLD